MEDKLTYPQIMLPGQLRGLNEYAISRLGTPLFFATPEPARPRASDSVGVLYEVITGLYLIYKDHGMQILQSYLTFCKDYVDAQSFVFPHYQSIKKLRGGFCHGTLPNGAHASALVRTLKYYLPHSVISWPDTIANMSESDCEEIVGKLSFSSDRLVKYIRTCADKISGDTALLRKWRVYLINAALNKDSCQYGKGKHYFDERIIGDLEREINRGAPSPHQLTVKNWLAYLEPKLLKGEILDSDELYLTLRQALDDLYHPMQIGATMGSAEVLMPDI